jgi:hypothetical protein
MCASNKTWPQSTSSGPVRTKFVKMRPFGSSRRLYSANGSRTGSRSVPRRNDKRHPDDTECLRNCAVPRRHQFDKLDRLVNGAVGQLG